MRNKNSAAILAFVLGIFGIHKFYLGETGWGIVYAIFFWTYIPAMAGFVEAIMLLVMPQEDFENKYNSRYLQGQQSRYLTNNPPSPQVIVNIGDKQIISSATDYNQNQQSKKPIDSVPKLSPEDIDRQILKLCQGKQEITLLDCFMTLEKIPKRIIQARLENLVLEEFLEITNRESDGKIVYRLND